MWRPMALVMAGGSLGYRRHESGSIRRMSEDPLMKVYNELVCEDTKVPAYQYVRSAPPPWTFAEARSYCDEKGMSLCTLDQLVKVFDAPGKHWKTDYGFVDKGDDSLFRASLAETCTEYSGSSCWEGKVPITSYTPHGVPYFHCCHSGLDSCGKLTTAQPKLDEMHSLWCEDTNSNAYSNMESDVNPKNLEETKKYCETAGMNLCTLDDLVVVSDSPARTWETAMSYADMKDGQKKDATVDNFPCLWHGLGCYQYRVHISMWSEDYLNTLHCCRSELHTCGSLHNGIPTDDAAVTTAAPDVTTTASSVDITVEGGFTPVFRVRAQLWCEDTNTPAYKLIESAPPPPPYGVPMPVARSFCEANAMKLCTMDEMVAVHDAPARKWYASTSYVESGSDTIKSASLPQSCSYNCYKGKVSFSESTEAKQNRMHCCGKSLASCRSMTSPPPRFKEIRNLWCKDTWNYVYKLIDPYELPRTPKDADDLCSVEGMKMCTLDDLITVFESSARSWKTVWGAVNTGSSEIKVAMIDDFTCGWDGAGCYKKKILVTTNEIYVSEVHCCRDGLQSCKSLHDDIVRTTIAPTESEAVASTIKAPSGGEVVVVVDVPLDRVSEIFE